MEHKSLIIKLAQNEIYYSKCEKVKNVKEFNQPSLNKVLSSIENIPSGNQHLTYNVYEYKECANVKSKIAIDSAQNEKYYVR